MNNRPEYENIFDDKPRDFEAGARRDMFNAEPPRYQGDEKEQAE